ncbi:MAG TPA: protein translocase subunit SecD [Gaiellales bacterium]|nr:protein translocase subunit SecD [Gaiellales bacterium]
MSSESRRNLSIMGLVLALAIAAGVAVMVKGFTLGLDLRGGLEVVLKARPTSGQSVSADTLSSAADVMRRRIDPQGTLQPEIRTSQSDSTIDISIPGVKNPNAVANLLVAGQLQSFDFYKALTPVSTQSTNVALPRTSLYDLLHAAKQQIPTGKPAGWALFSQAKPHNLARANGVTSRVEPEQQQVLEDIHLKTQPAGTVWLPVPAGTQAVSCNDVCPDATAPGTVWYLFRPPTQDSQIVTGDEISSAKADVDPNTGQPVVSLSYKNGGDQDFTNITRQIAQEGLAAQRSLLNAIVVDNKLVAAPTVDFQQYPNGIDATLTGGSEINGVSSSEAKRIALEITSGTLPVKFTPLSQQLVSATLGENSLRDGLIAGAAGLVFVMIFLVVFYGFLGLIADLALVIYGLLLAGIVAALPVTMTLPGIAGTILTIGVAADANIVIFERIKEEVRAGRSIRAAISTGYRRGFHTIIDANVVTLITAGILYAAATSSVKGFALMLLIGVATSIFTAVVATRAMLGLLSGFRFMTSHRVLGSIGTGDRWKKYDFIGKLKLWFAISGVVLVIGAIALATTGLNEGIDFTGGSKLDFNTAKAATVVQVSDAAHAAGVSDPVVKGLTSTGSAQGNTFTRFEVESHFLTTNQSNKLQTELSSRFGQLTNLDSRSVSSSFGQSVLDSAYLAILFSLIIIFLYVSFRFEWKYAVPVMVALAHDILITVGVYAISGRTVTADTVAAVLTVLGYSMYDTVIVFDRVRENVPILRRMTASKIVNESLAETITRSLNTSLVTLIPVVLLFIFGSGSLKDFAFALIVGIASGAYSSIFIAAPILAVFMEREPGFQKRRADLAKSGETAPAGKPAAAPAPVPVGAEPADGTPTPPPPPTRRRRRRAHGRAR